MKNPDLLQESEVANSDVDLTAYASKIIEDDNNMNISTEEEQNNVEYQEILKGYVKNITKKYGDQYMKLLMLHLLKRRIYFHKSFKTYVKKYKPTSVSTI